MKYLISALNWTFGVLFAITGAVSLFEAPLAGLCILAMSGLLLPPVRSFVHAKTSVELPTKARAASIVVLLIAVGIFSNQAELKKSQIETAQKLKEQEAKRAEAKQEKINYFEANRVQIISSIAEAFAAGKYAEAVKESRKYLVTGNDQIVELHQKSKHELDEIKKSEKTSDILAKLKTIPTSSYARNRDLYGQLVSLHPENTAYKEKLKFYTGKIKEKEQKEIADKNRKEKVESQFSAWDGSHRGLTRIIKEAMNDPGSYDHAETRYSDKGSYLIVRTVYRGKNAFGGIVKNAITAKVDLNGNVLEIISQEP